MLTIYLKVASIEAYCATCVGSRSKLMFLGQVVRRNSFQLYSARPKFDVPSFNIETYD